MVSILTFVRCNNKILIIMHLFRVMLFFLHLYVKPS
jgi:hypothetical protein